MKIYFAHPVNTYNDDTDRLCINIIKNELGNQIINPSDDLIQSTFKEYRLKHPDTYMEFFKDLVSSCDTIVYLPFKDGKIGAGIWFEVKSVSENGGKIFEINLNKTDDVYLNPLMEVDFEHVNNNKLSVDETRIRIKTIF